VCLSLVGPSDKASYAKICKAMHRSGISEYPIDGTMLRGVQERVSLAVKIDKILSKKKKAKSNDNWFIKNAKMMDIDIDEGLLNAHTEDSKREKQDAARVKQMQQTLSALLRKPLVAQGVSRKYFHLNTVKPKAGAKLVLGSIRR